MTTLQSRLLFKYRLFRYALPYRWHTLRCRLLEWRHPGYLEKVQKEDIAPVFIMGAGRSGNTLLARLLHETGGVHFGPENFTLCKTYLSYLRCIDAPWELRVDRILGILAGQDDSHRWDKVDLGEVRKYLLASGEHTLGNIIHAWYLYYGRGINYPSERWGCKTPNLTPFADEFMKVFPNASIIQLLRRPRHVAASFARAGIKPYDVEAMGYVHWLYFNECLDKIARKLVVRFSELTATPDDVLRMLMHKINIKPGEHSIPFENPDLNYDHLRNVNDKIEKKDQIQTGRPESLESQLEDKYESY